jgi:hypothetical protein
MPDVLVRSDDTRLSALHTADPTHVAVALPNLAIAFSHRSVASIPYFQCVA